MELAIPRAGLMTRSGGRTSPPPTRLASVLNAWSLSFSIWRDYPPLNRLVWGEALLQKAPEQLMRDCACHSVHRQADAAHEVLKSRVGANWVPLRVNIQPSHGLALSERFFERLHCQVFVP